MPYVFTEQGIAMLSSVLNSKQAVQVNILIIRAFVKLRELLATNKEVAKRLEDLERRQDRQEERTDQVVQVIEALMAPEPVPPKQRIGFYTSEEND